MITLTSSDYTLTFSTTHALLRFAADNSGIELEETAFLRDSAYYGRTYKDVDGEGYIDRYNDLVSMRIDDAFHALVKAVSF